MQLLHAVLDVHTMWLLHYYAGEWFCPRCEKELGRTDDPGASLGSLHATRFMKQEDFHRSLAHALGQSIVMF